MSYKIGWIPNEPILLITGSGVMTGEDFEQIFAEVASMIEDVEGIIYRIEDYTHADSSFMDIMQVVQLISDEPPEETAAESRIRSIYVGTPDWIALARLALRMPQYEGVIAPTFSSLEDALSYSRREIAKTRGVTGFLTNVDYFHRISAKDWKDAP